MYEISVTYKNKTDQDVLLCSTKPSFDVTGGFILINGGGGQRLAVSVNSLFKMKITPPLPDRLPPLKYSVDIHYDTDTEDTEMLFSSSEVYITTDGIEGGFTPVILVKEADNIVRVINSSLLRSVKVNSYTEENK